MKIKDLEEKLYYLYSYKKFEEIISIARKEFLKGNREIYLWTFLADAYYFIPKLEKRAEILTKIALNLINEKLKEKESEKLLFYSALMNLNLEKYEKAFEYCNKLIKLNPKNSEYYYIKGCVKYELKNYTESIDLLTKAIDLNSDNINIL